MAALSVPNVYTLHFPRTYGDGQPVPCGLWPVIEGRMADCFERFMRLPTGVQTVVGDDGAPSRCAVQGYHLVAADPQSVLTFAREVGQLLLHPTVDVGLPNGAWVVLAIDLAPYYA